MSTHTQRCTPMLNFFDAGDDTHNMALKHYDKVHNQFFHGPAPKAEKQALPQSVAPIER